MEVASSYSNYPSPTQRKLLTSWKSMQEDARVEAQARRDQWQEREASSSKTTDRSTQYQSSQSPRTSPTASRHSHTPTRQYIYSSEPSQPHGSRSHHTSQPHHSSSGSSHTIHSPAHHSPGSYTSRSRVTHFNALPEVVPTAPAATSLSGASNSSRGTHNSRATHATHASRATRKSDDLGRSVTIQTVVTSKPASHHSTSSAGSSHTSKRAIAMHPLSHSSAARERHPIDAATVADSVDLRHDQLGNRSMRKLRTDQYYAVVVEEE